jgi:hypothetical protein
MVGHADEERNVMMSFLPGERCNSGVTKFKLSMVQNVQKSQKKKAGCC